MFYLKVICLFVAVFFSLINITLGLRNKEIPAMNFILNATGITGFIVLQWLV